MLTHSWGELDRLVYPSIVHSSRFGSQHYDLSLMRAIWAFFTVALLGVTLGTILVATSGIPFEAALTAAVSAFSTIGPLYEAGWGGPGAGGWPPFADLTGLAKVSLMALMVLGRLESLALLAILLVRLR